MMHLLSWIAYRWVARQHKSFYKLGEPLSSNEREALLTYFNPDVLRKTRKVFLDKVQPLDFPTKLRLSLLKFLFQIRQLAGLTLMDCVFFRAGILDQDPRVIHSVLFHELVHVTQYDLLGSKEFIKRYLQSWAGNGFSYEKISFERVAYGLTHHYETFPDRPFSVKERVIQGLEIK